jgi:hypothetical protein
VSEAARAAAPAAAARKKKMRIGVQVLVMRFMIASA